jgi:hypothetical protein
VLPTQHPVQWAFNRGYSEVKNAWIHTYTLPLSLRNTNRNEFAPILFRMAFTPHCIFIIPYTTCWVVKNETENVYCAVRTELYVLQVPCGLIMWYGQHFNHEKLFQDDKLRNNCRSEANSNISFLNMQTDDIETTATRSALVPRGIFCVLVARWQQATVCVGVWAGRQIASGIVVSRPGTRRREYGMLHLPSHFSFFSLTIIIAIIPIITEVTNAERLTRNISCCYLASL